MMSLQSQLVEHRLAAPSGLRAKLERLVEDIIDVLDDADGDVDLETSGDDEPNADDEPTDSTCPMGMTMIKHHTYPELFGDGHDR